MIAIKLPEAGSRRSNASPPPAIKAGDRTNAVSLAPEAAVAAGVPGSRRPFGPYDRDQPDRAGSGGIGRRGAGSIPRRHPSPVVQQRLMNFQALRHCTFSAHLDCHYLLHVPDAVTPATLLVVTLHGFGSNPETMMRLTGMMAGDAHVIASLQGPNHFYTDAKAENVGYGWITRRQAASSIRLHHEMVLHVLDEAGRNCGIPPGRRILAGFSQSVGLNYRLAATHPDAVRGVVGVCGGLPSDWETGPYQAMKASVLHIARRGDEFYPPGVTEQYPQRLGLRAADVEFHLIDGGHAFPSKARVFAEPWIARIIA